MSPRSPHHPRRSLGRRPKTPSSSIIIYTPGSLFAALEDFLTWSETHHFAERTVLNRRITIRLFIEWCELFGIQRPEEVTMAILERYQRHLYYYRHPKHGRPLSFRSQMARLLPIRSFFKWLAQQKRIPFNPASELTLPKQEKRLPRNVMTAAEAETVINQPDIHEPFGLRDRAMLEVLYATGLRRMELCQVKAHDIDWERGTLFVRQGKGRKDRVVPLGERAQAWCEKYRHEVRPLLMVPPDEDYLFLTRYGERFLEKRLSEIVHHYIKTSGIQKQGSCHLFRHTMATVMLENGADIRFIQQMLGHASLETTEIYTHISIQQLVEVHQRTHPAAKLNRRSADDPPPLGDPEAR